MYENFDAASLMQQAPANFLSPETMALMPSFSSAGSVFGQALDDFSFMGEGFQGYSNPNLAGSWMNMLQPITRFGIGGAMTQPDNSDSLPGATTTLPASPESPKPMSAFDKFLKEGIAEGADPTTVTMLKGIYAMKEDGRSDWKEQFDAYKKMRKEEAEAANKMGQWNTVLGSFIKDVPKALSEPARRRNMYLGDMLRSQADLAREQSVGIRQAMASIPGAPARNYIRI